MAKDHGMTYEAIQVSIRDALKAAVRQDQEAADAAMEPLFADDSCVWDSFSWTVGLIQVAVSRLGVRPGDFAIPLVRLHLPDGSSREFHADDAPPECPPGLVALMRLQAHVLNDEREEAKDVWEAALKEDIATVEAGQALGLPAEDQAPSILADIMERALASAARTIHMIAGTTPPPSQP